MLLPPGIRHQDRRNRGYRLRSSLPLERSSDHSIRQIGKIHRTDAFDDYIEEGDTMDEGVNPHVDAEEQKAESHHNPRNMAACFFQATAPHACVQISFTQLALFCEI